jgi:hypothetical protein
MSKNPDLPKTRAFAKNPTYENWKVLPTVVQNFMLMQANSSNLKRNKEFMKVVDDNRDAYKHIDKLEKILHSIVQSIDQLSSVQVEQAFDTKNKIDQIMTAMNTFEQKTAKKDVMEVIKSLDAKIEEKFSQYVNMINNKQTSSNPKQKAVIDEQAGLINAYKQQIDEQAGEIVAYKQRITEQADIIDEYKQRITEYAKSYDNLKADLTSKLEAAKNELSKVNSVNEMTQVQNSTNTSFEEFDGMKYNVMTVPPYYKSTQEAFNNKVQELKEMKDNINEAIILSNQFIPRYQNLKSGADVNRVKKTIDKEISKFKGTNRIIYNVCVVANKKIAEEATAIVKAKIGAGKQKAAADKKAEIAKNEQERIKKESEAKAEKARKEARKVVEEEARKAAEEEVKRQRAAVEEDNKRQKEAKQEAERQKAAEEEVKRQKAAKQVADEEEAKKREKAAEEDKRLQTAREEAKKEAEKIARREANEEAARLALADAEQLALEEATRLAIKRQVVEDTKNLEEAAKNLERDLKKGNATVGNSSVSTLRERMLGRLARQQAQTAQMVKETQAEQVKIETL